MAIGHYYNRTQPQSISSRMANQAGTAVQPAVGLPAAVLARAFNMPPLLRAPPLGVTRAHPRVQPAPAHEGHSWNSPQSRSASLMFQLGDTMAEVQAPWYCCHQDATLPGTSAEVLATGPGISI